MSFKRRGHRGSTRRDHRGVMNSPCVLCDCASFIGVLVFPSVSLRLKNSGHILSTRTNLSIRTIPHLFSRSFHSSAELTERIRRTQRATDFNLGVLCVVFPSVFSALKNSGHVLSTRTTPSTRTTLIISIAHFIPSNITTDRL